jgi:ParB-like chromosome segregation protein Spo0J
MEISDRYQVMPPLTREEYWALKEDIAENGVLVSVVQDEEGTIIDGHYRVQAYQELEAEGRAAGGFPTQERTGLTEDEKRDLAWRLNMQRRHLNQAQKQEAIRKKLKESPEWADNRIAQLLGVDHKTVRVHRVMLEGIKGIPKVQKVIGTDGKEYPRELEKRVKGKLQDAGFNRTFAAGLAQGLVQGAVTRERESPLRGAGAEVGEEHTEPPEPGVIEQAEERGLEVPEIPQGPTLPEQAYIAMTELAILSKRVPPGEAARAHPSSAVAAQLENLETFAHWAKLFVEECYLYTEEEQDQ